MASTYTANLKIELITPGEQSGAWGTTTNNNFTNSIEQAIVGQASVSFPSNADLTLTLTDQPASVAQSARSFFLAVTSAVSLTTTRTLTLPAINKTYLISNGTTGAQAISVARTGGGTTVTVPNGARVLVYASSTGVAPQITHVPALTVGSTAGATETVVTTGGTQTLTNKTLATPVVTGVTTIPTGTALAPSVSFSGDPNTGIYSPSGDQVAISTDGVQRLLLSSAGVNQLTLGQGGGGFQSNTVLGRVALPANTTGQYNTAMGEEALNQNTVGSYNTALGWRALRNNLDGTQNVAVGHEPLRDNTSGFNNVAVGHLALAKNTTGYGNSSIGAETLQENTTGYYNLALGQAALKANTTGYANVALGQSTLIVNLTGANNTAIGSSALDSNTTGSGNTAIGALALSANTTGGQAVAIGNEALRLSTGDYNIGVGYRAGDAITSGALNIIVGAFSDTSSATVNNEIIIGNSLTGKGDDTAFIGGANGAYNGKNVTTWETTSDARIKKNIVDNADGLALIEQIRVRNFEYRTPAEITELPKAAAIDKPGVQLGVIAQELQGVLPACVTENSTGVLSVSTDPLVWYLINAVQELSARVKELESRQ